MYMEEHLDMTLRDVLQMIQNTVVSTYVDDGLVPAGIVQATRNEIEHALPAHVGEIHRWAGLDFRVRSRLRFDRWLTLRLRLCSLH